MTVPARTLMVPVSTPILFEPSKCGLAAELSVSVTAAPEMLSFLNGVIFTKATPLLNVKVFPVFVVLFPKIANALFGAAAKPLPLQSN